MTRLLLLAVAGLLLAAPVGADDDEDRDDEDSAHDGDDGREADPDQRKGKDKGEKDKDKDDKDRDDDRRQRDGKRAHGGGDKGQDEADPLTATPIPTLGPRILVEPVAAPLADASALTLQVRNAGDATASEVHVASATPGVDWTSAGCDVSGELHCQLGDLAPGAAHVLQARLADPDDGLTVQSWTRLD